MGVFGKFSLKGKKPTVRGQYLTPGEYVLEIKDMKMVDVRQKPPMFVADLEVIEASEDATVAVGATRQWAAPTGEDWAGGAIVGLLMAANGFEPDDPKGLDKDWDPTLETAIGEKKSENGKKVVAAVVSRLKAKYKDQPENDKPENYRNYTTFYPFGD